MAATQDQATTRSHYFSLKLGGKEGASFFMELSGIGSENQIIEQKTMSPNGRLVIIQKLPGQASWPNITLKRGIDKDNQLWLWRQQVIDGQIQQARVDGVIEVLDSMGTPLVTFSFVKGWPCKYSAPTLTAAGNEAMVEEIEIAHEGLKRA